MLEGHIHLQILSFRVRETKEGLEIEIQRSSGDHGTY